jgi:predicted TIM-barrel fold metal-dependent hydrolase
LAPLPNPAPRPEWLALRPEAALEPALPIVDAHHHLWSAPHPRYLLDELLADLRSGHDIRATVCVEAHYGWRNEGPEALRPVGEVEHAASIASHAAHHEANTGHTIVNAAIVAHADLSLGERVEPVLDALIEAGGGRLRGIRHSSANDPQVRALAPPGMLRDPAFQAGFACLQRRDLSFDMWTYHPQLADALALVRAFPEAPIVVNHLGGRIGVGRYADTQQDVARQWEAALRDLAAFPNVHLKLSGLGMMLAGFALDERATPPSSDDLVALWGPRVALGIDIFGARRCMFASNFPVDKAACSYTVLWNAFKKMTRHMDPSDRQQLFAQTAVRFYSIDIPTIPVSTKR